MIKYKLISAWLLIMALCACVSTPQTQLTAKQIKVLQDTGFVHTSQGWMFDVKSKILFGLNNDDVPINNVEVVTKIGQALVDAELLYVRLDGYTDNIGNAQYNQQLSLRRAEKVAAVLVSAGLQKQNLTIRGLGERNPVASNATEAGRSENRRVVMVILD